MTMLKNELPRIVTKQIPGPKAAKWIARRGEAVPSAIKCVYPIVIARGEGAMLEDVDGNYFLDWVGGVGVLNIGYSRPELIEAVKNSQSGISMECLILLHMKDMLLWQKS